MKQQLKQQKQNTKGGILAKLQEMPQDLQLLFLLVFLLWAQQKGIDVALLQLNPQALEEALTLFVSELQQQLATKAAHGAKLNYVRKITNRCADDEETYFYKVGGKIGCGCKKKEQGGKVADDGKSVIARFKEKCGGKMKKHQLGGSLNGIPFMLGGNKVPSIGTTYYGYVLDKNRSLFGSGFRWYPTNAPIGKRAVGLDKSITINGITLNPDGTWSKKESSISTYIPVRTTTSTDSLAFPSDTLVQDSIVAPIDTARIDTLRIPSSLIAAGDSIAARRDSTLAQRDSIPSNTTVISRPITTSTNSKTTSNSSTTTLKRSTGNTSTRKTTTNSSVFWKKKYDDWNNGLTYDEMKALDNLGINFSEGTKKLQLELNRVFSLKYGNNPAFGAPLVEDGKLGPKTLAKIKNAIYLGMSSSTNEFKKGGSLNRIPFYQKGTPKEGITEKSDNTRVQRTPNNGEGVYEQIPINVWDFVPVVGTYREALRLDQGDPNASVIRFGISLAGDLAGAGMIGSVAKAAGRVNRIQKALRARGYLQFTKDGSLWFRLPKKIIRGYGDKLYTYEIPNIYGESLFKTIPTVDYTPAVTAPLVLTLRVPAEAPFFNYSK